MTADPLRLFFALDPPGRVRAAAAKLQRRLALNARPVPLENFHVTLAFLGELPAACLPDLRGIAGEASFSAGVLRLDRIGWFPRAGVAWLGPDTIPGGLQDFQAALMARLRGGGFRLERRRWAPHLTLYRKLRTPPVTIDFNAITWPVKGFCLMQSTPGDAGPVYRTLARW